MSKKSVAKKDERFYHQARESMIYHQTLLRDERRNKPFLEALQRTVEADTRVLDIGSGSGVWAIVAAKLGAKSVTAIEGNSTMLPVIMGHAVENKVADRLKIINGTSTDVSLKEKFDIIVSETIGNQAFDEDIIPTMVDARSRFLADGGRLIPQKVSLMAAPVKLLFDSKIPAGVPIDANYLTHMAMNLPLTVLNKSLLEFLAKPEKLIETDLRTCDADTALSDMQASWSLKKLKHANGVALWAKSELVDDIVLDSWDTSSWNPVVCRFRPFEQAKGNLKFSLTISGKLYHWKTECDGKVQAYAPVFAYTKLRLDSARAPKQSPRRRK